jgi:hypothetical protein
MMFHDSRELSHPLLLMDLPEELARKWDFSHGKKF